MFQARDVRDLCVAARQLGGDSAAPEAIAQIVSRAIQQEPQKILEVMLSQVRQELKTYSDPAQKLEMLSRIAGLTGRAEDFRAASELLQYIPSRNTRAQAKSLIVRAYIAAGKLSEARCVASSIRSAVCGGESWLEIAAKTRKLEDVQRAETCCADIKKDPYAKEELEGKIRSLKRSLGL